MMAQVQLQPRWYLNGFPKSGLHWMQALVGTLAQPVDEDPVSANIWAGSFCDNGWSEEWIESELVLYRAGRLQDGRLVLAHCGYKPEFEQFLWYLGAAVVFVHRDFRDVAVSQAHHVLSEDDDRFFHPDKDHYRAMGSFDDVLKAVIVGDKWPGLFDRWQHYAGWLAVDWVHCVRYEDLCADIQTAARALSVYGLQRAAGVYGASNITIPQEQFAASVAQMVDNGAKTGQSATFRRGGTGHWREYFTPEIKIAFKAADHDGWLVRLGYEPSGDW